MRTLTWCANLQPAADLEALERFLQGQASAVREALGGRDPLGLGLWLPAEPAGLLARSPGAVEALAEGLARRGLFLATVNAFPMGRFHGPGVKEKVYLPSWAEKDRLVYTVEVLEVAAALGPGEGVLPVSTLPLGFLLPGEEERGLVGEATANLLEAARAAEEAGGKRGADLVLSLEPEPGCLLERTEDFLDWFLQILLPAARRRGLEDVCRRRIGVCLDACHCAVMGEDPLEALRSFSREGIRVGKIQLSSALEVFPGKRGWREALEAFAEPCYLHQTTWWDRRGGRKAFFPDLPQALAGEGGEEAAFWRVHFHLPIFWEGEGPLAGTGPKVLPDLLAERELLPSVLEVETYTWKVLPWVRGEEEILEGVVKELSFAGGLL